MYKKNLLALAASAGLATQASAAVVNCPSSQIVRVSVTDNGAVIVRTGFGIFVPCTVPGSLSNVSADTCRTWVSQMISARALGKPVFFYFVDDHPSNFNTGMSTACAQSDFNGQVRVPSEVRIDFD